MSNVYLEKIAGFKLPKALGRYGGTNYLNKEKVSVHDDSTTGKLRNFVRTALDKGSARDKASRMESTAKHFNETYNNFKASPDKVKYRNRQAKEHGAWLRYMRESTQRQSDRAKRVADLSAEGARKTLGAIVGGTAAVGIGGTVAYNKAKKED